jgi:hypothetical protein
MNGCVSLWIGESLGPVERACLRSVLRQGHHLTLYCYGSVAGVPDGVIVEDAGEIIPEAEIFRHDEGSVGHFSDWFRYELQRRGLGTWIDTDVYLLRPLDEERAYLFGEQAPGVLNNAVLRLAEDSPLLSELLRPFRERVTPAWLPLPVRITAKLRELTRGKADLGRLPWGSTGPQALTALARKYSLMSEAVPQDVLYPVAWQRAGWIIDPRIALQDVVSERTVAVHLWNECIRTITDNPAAEGSFLHRLQCEAAAESIGDGS